MRRILLLSLFLSCVATAAEPQGVDRCLLCHNGHAQVREIFFTPHGVRADARTPMGGRQCQACHGDSEAHATDPATTPKPTVTFKADANVSAATQNGACLTCHDDLRRTHWSGSAHERAGMRCVDCHTVHRDRDPILIPAAQQERCVACHRTQRADMLKLSGHPLRDKSMGCADCHASHGAPGDSSLAGATLNQTCFRCHADKRGPFLWEHAPVREDCNGCHLSHGSNHPALLRTRVPFLCQQCHSAAGHPSTALDSGSLDPVAFNSRFVLGTGCLNCHGSIHGSNHPSGVKFNR